MYEKPFCFFIFCFIFCADVFAQANKTSPCPTISVTGPSGITQPNEPMIFGVSVSKEAENYKIVYEWAVSTGEIIEG